MTKGTIAPGRPLISPPLYSILINMSSGLWKVNKAETRTFEKTSFRWTRSAMEGGDNESQNQFSEQFQEKVWIIVQGFEESCGKGFKGTWAQSLSFLPFRKDEVKEEED